MFFQFQTYNIRGSRRLNNRKLRSVAQFQVYSAAAQNTAYSGTTINCCLSEFLVSQLRNHAPLLPAYMQHGFQVNGRNTDPTLIFFAFNMTLVTACPMLCDASVYFSEKHFAKIPRDCVLFCILMPFCFTRFVGFFSR